MRKQRWSQILSATRMNKRKWAQTETWEIPFKQKMTQEKEEEKNATFLLWGWGSTRTGCPGRLQCPSSEDIQNPTEHDPEQAAVAGAGLEDLWVPASIDCAEIPKLTKSHGQSHNKDYFSSGKKVLIKQE